MRVVCAWCLEEGKPALVREKEPIDDPEATHGVCPEHKARLKAADPLSVLEFERAGGEEEPEKAEPRGESRGSA